MPVLPPEAMMQPQGAGPMAGPMAPAPPGPPIPTKRHKSGGPGGRKGRKHAGRKRKNSRAGHAIRMH